MIGGQSAARMNDRHSFPVGGLVELSRATYQSTPLAVVEIRPTVFSFIGATSRDRVQKLKSAQEAVAEKAFADLDPPLAPRDHQLRPVDPNRLSDALSLPAAYFPDEESVKAVLIKEQQK